MNEKFAKERSKMLSSILRHNPDKIGIELGIGGWVGVEELLAGLSRIGRGLTRDQLNFVIQNNDKKRFTLSDDGTQIRAAQGHSIDIVSDLIAVTPPEVLYHGTATRFLEQILQEGLLAMNRTHVHLSLNVETALKVGSRHGKPCLLVVDAKNMSKNGHEFFLADNGVWLAHSVPPEFLIVKSDS